MAAGLRNKRGEDGFLQYIYIFIYLSDDFVQSNVCMRVSPGHRRSIKNTAHVPPDKCYTNISA